MGVTFKLSESQFKMIINKVINENLLVEETYNDIFEFLGQGFGKMTQGSVYYISSMDKSMNKNIVNAETGEKSPNPMYGKLFKHTRFLFRWGDTFQRAKERKGLGGEVGARSGEFEKLEGFDMVETGKNGLYLPIIPTGSEYVYSVKEGDSFVEISKEEVRPYLRPSNFGGEGPEFRLLLVDNIAKITGGGNMWINGELSDKYVGPGEI